MYQHPTHTPKINTVLVPTPKNNIPGTVLPVVLYPTSTIILTTTINRCQTTQSKTATHILTTIPPLPVFLF
jgi:hypothetical protein